MEKVNVEDKINENEPFRCSVCQAKLVNTGHPYDFEKRKEVEAVMEATAKRVFEETDLDEMVFNIPGEGGIIIYKRI